METFTFQPLTNSCVRLTALAFAFIGGLLACRPERPHSLPVQPVFPARFALTGDSTWHIPEPGKITRLELALTMTNLGKETIRFLLMDKFSLSLADSNGRRLTMEGGRDSLVDKDPYSGPVAPGGTFLYRLNCHLAYGLNGQLELIIGDGYGGSWQIAPLSTGNYLLIMKYTNVLVKKKQPQGVWQGSAEIDPFPIHIVRN